MTAAPLTQAEHWVLEATPDQSNHDLTLTASATGTELARLTAEPHGERVEVRPATGEPWPVEAYGRGWKLVARTADEEARPLLWFTGRLLRSGGEILVAPAREYDLRSRILKRLDAHIITPEGDLLIEAHAIPAHDTETVHVTLHDPHHPDAELLATFGAVHGLLVYRTARRQSGYGGDGGGAA
jgi:hypothetical protein